MTTEKTARFVCIGWREASGGGLTMGLREVALETNALGEPKYFKPTKQTRLFHAGGIYTIPGDQDGWFLGKAKYVGFFEDAALRAEWKAEQEIAEAAIAIKKREKAETVGQLELLEALRPWRRVYQSTNTRGQVTLDAMVLRALHSFEPAFLNDQSRRAP